MTKVIVYHDSETLARRARRVKPGETISYRSIEDFDGDINKDFDEVLNFATPKLKPIKSKK